MLIGQMVYGIHLLFLWIIMPHFSESAYMLMVLFNPLPLLLWRWHRYWALPYAILLATGIIVLACWPHMLIDPAFLVLGVAYVILFAKDSIKRFVTSLITCHQ